VGGADPYSGTAQSLVRQGIPAVVAMQFEISDTAAITLARSLYEAVADGYPLDAATAEARKAVRHQPNPVEWGTPVLYLRAPDGRIFDVPSVSTPTGLALAQAADNDGRTPQQDTPVEPYDDPDYTAALAAYFTERWDTAVELLTRVLKRYPDHPHAAERLAEARRQQRLAGWDADARHAAEQGRWDEAVEALEHIAETQPDLPDIAQRLNHARTQHEITSLQADLRRMHTARQWTAVVAIGEQLAEHDPSSADPDGLVTAARAELAEAAIANLYNTGLRQLDSGDQAAAAETFAAIEAERPGYRDTTALLARARGDQPAQPAEEQQPPVQRAPASTTPPETVTPDQAAIGEAPRPPSWHRRWLARSALLTGGLVVAFGIAVGIDLGDPSQWFFGLLVALPFLVGWLLLRSRPKIGAAVTGICAAGWSILVLVGLSDESADDITNLGYLFLYLSVLSALAAVVLSVLVIRNPS
jgi:tetratricopeptide (TPR) repeat protein